MKDFTRLFKTCLLTIALANATSTQAQNQNALSFDGNDDYLVTPGASALVSGSNQLSMTCWVYPTNPTPNTTSYDGICGLRNNVDGDFYMLHYTATSIEARFRNSSGVNYDILGNGIQINTWQHLAFTYDGSMLRYYNNGIKLDSLAATGNITVSGDAFYIGALPFQASLFYLIGKIDEVSLWDKALSGPEITCVYGGGIDTSDANLKLYYKLNQGVAGGTNTSVTTATDNSGHIDAALSGFALAGSSSNWVAGVNQGSSAAATICTGSSYTFGTQTITTAGTYTETFQSSTGCDSTVNLTVTVSTIDTSVSVVSNILTALQTGATYQWINCITGLPVPGATLRNFTTAAGGTYACVISFANCSDTSGCRTILATGLNEMIQANDVALYPNPSTNQFTVDMGTTQPDLTVSVKSLEGKEMMIVKYSDVKQFSMNASTWSSGVYIMELSTPAGKAYKRLMKK